MKFCNKCKTNKPFKDFAGNKCKKDGLQAFCKECTNAYNKIRYKGYWKEQVNKGNKKRKEQFRQKIWDFLIEHPCVDCGESDPIVLQFDHIIGTKLESISTLVSKMVAWAVILNEITKCEIRCANCHLRKTSNQIGWYKNQR